jgi:hypothetical protein
MQSIFAAPRQIIVRAEGNGDVSSDVARIRATIDDSFEVTEVRVRWNGDVESIESLDINFTEMTITARSGGSSIISLIKAAELLGHRRPTDFSALEASGSDPEIE